MAKPTRRACDQCLGTDTQYECERGQCYAEEYLSRQAESYGLDERDLPGGIFDDREDH